jgi:hypothetical protein
MFDPKEQVVLPIQAVVQKARQSNDGDKTRQQTEVFMREGTDLERQMSCWPVHLSHDKANFPVQRLSDGLTRPWDIVTGQEMIAPQRRRPQHINVALKAYSDENRGTDFATKINRHGPPSTTCHAISGYPASCNPPTFPVFLDAVDKTAYQPSLPVGFEGLISDSFELAFQLPLYTSNLDLSTGTHLWLLMRDHLGQYQIRMKPGSRYRQKCSGNIETFPGYGLPPHNLCLQGTSKLPAPLKDRRRT